MWIILVAAVFFIFWFIMWLLEDTAKTLNEITEYFTHRKCPYCESKISKTAKVCKFCQREVVKAVDEEPSETLQNKNKSDEPFLQRDIRITPKVRSVLSWIFGILFAIIGFSAVSKPLTTQSNFIIDIVFGIIFLVMASILLPPISRLFENRFNVQLSKKFKTLVLGICFVLLIVLANSFTEGSNSGSSKTEKLSLINKSSSSKPSMTKVSADIEVVRDVQIVVLDHKEMDYIQKIGGFVIELEEIRTAYDAKVNESYTQLSADYYQLAGADSFYSSHQQEELNRLYEYRHAVRLVEANAYLNKWLVKSYDSLEQMDVPVRFKELHNILLSAIGNYTQATYHKEKELGLRNSAEENAYKQGVSDMAVQYWMGQANSHATKSVFHFNEFEKKFQLALKDYSEVLGKHNFSLYFEKPKSTKEEAKQDGGNNNEEYDDILSSGGKEKSLNEGTIRTPEEIYPQELLDKWKAGDDSKEEDIRQNSRESTNEENTENQSPYESCIKDCKVTSKDDRKDCLPDAEPPCDIWIKNLLKSCYSLCESNYKK